MKKSLIIKSIVMTALAMSLVGCTSSVTLAEVTKEKLEEKYGEEFEIIHVSGDGHTTTVCPVANPEQRFTAYYWANSGEGKDSYIQEIVCSQYKKLAEEVLKDFEYDYFLDVDLEYGYEPVNAGTDVTIEEYVKVNQDVTKPEYYWYVSDKALEMGNEKIYFWINKIAELPVQENSKVRIFFVDDENMNLVRDNYTNFAYAQDEFYGILSRNVSSVSQHLSEKKLLIDYSRFSEIMNGE